MLKLPVDFGAETGIVFPEVAIAVEAPSGILIDIAMDHLSGEPAIEFMIGTLRKRSVPIEVDTALVVAMAHALPNGAPIIPITSTNARKALANLVGRNIGRLELAYKPLVAPPGKFMQSGKDRAPSRADAELALQIASNRHNADLDALHANAAESAAPTLAASRGSGTTGPLTNFRSSVLPYLYTEHKANKHCAG